MDLTPQELKEVLTIFKAETTEYIHLLNKGFMKLEDDPSDLENITEIFRTAHSIKGAARMLGLEPIEKLAHELEDTLGLVKNSKLETSDHILDVLYKSVDKIESIIKVLSNSDNPDLSVVSIIDEVNLLREIQSKELLKEETQLKEEKPKEELKKEKKIEKEEESFLFEENLAFAQPKEEQIKNPEQDAESIDFIRISVEHIDSLMRSAGELNNTKVQNQKLHRKIEDLYLRVMKFDKKFEQRYKLIQKLDSLYTDAIEDFAMDKFSEIEQNEIAELLLSFSHLFEGGTEQLEEIFELKSETVIHTNIIIDTIQEKIRETRLIPFSHVLSHMPRMIRDIAKKTNKKVDFKIYGEETKIDKYILEKIKDPLVHILRNSVDHGIEEPDYRIVEEKPALGKIEIKIKYEGNSVLIDIYDDGKGLDIEKIKKKALDKKIITETKLQKMNKTEIFNLTFTSGFSTSEQVTDISGRGFGMEIVKRKIEELKGVIFLISEKGKGTTVRIRLPITLATVHVLTVESVDELYALPIISAERILRIHENEIEKIGNKKYITINNNSIMIMNLDDLMDKPRRKFKHYSKKTNDKRFNHYTGILLNVSERKLVVLVDRVVDEQEVVIKQFSSQFKKMKNIMGATIFGSGKLVVVLDPAKIINSAYDLDFFETTELEEDKKKELKVLVVDDSITTRTLEKNILEHAGHDVTIAIHGLDAWQKLNENPLFDIIISDVEMPNMTGYELVEKIKNHSEFKKIPTVLVTSLANAQDREKGLFVGADAYLTKGAFDQKNLLSTIEKLTEKK
jgi:two-component system chemotaxis sensor kinase CheA